MKTLGFREAAAHVTPGGTCHLPTSTLSVEETHLHSAYVKHFFLGIPSGSPCEPGWTHTTLYALGTFYTKLSAQITVRGFWSTFQNLQFLGVPPWIAITYQNACLFPVEHLWVSFGCPSKLKKKSRYPKPGMTPSLENISKAFLETPWKICMCLCRLLLAFQAWGSGPPDCTSVDMWFSPSDS